ncbi:MAG TPA: lanthionine synthetase LanC family protein [Streptosporangiaceae bacterium]|nr:lanthionine synthetase LanC family protein [Streptosporangiaceae bacterium]
MDHDDLQGLLEQAAAERSAFGYRVHSGPTWLAVSRDGLTLPEHGWKLHVSSRPATLSALVEKLLPVLLDGGHIFKVVRSRQTLARLNNGISSPAAVGKAFTIYPAQQQVRELGLRLANLLRGDEAPRVLSDRQVDPGAPVYYRYGPFRRNWRTDTGGRMVTLIRGPGGEEFGGLATMRYRQPAWTTDPFTGMAGGEQKTTAGQVVGGRYRIVAGLYESARGNVYRGIDQRDGTSVVIKQARALVDEHDSSGDVRLRLRNERRILTVLDGVRGVPRFIDHFKHGCDEFLVTSDAGPHNLLADVVSNGRYLPAGHAEASGWRTLDALGGRLARIVLDVHARGVVLRDIAAKNVVVDGPQVTLIDFGFASHDGVHIPGGTPGFAPARQLRDEPPRDTDDLFALGMTLLYAAHSILPVSLEGDPDAARQRALQAISAQYGATPSGVIGKVAALLSDDDDVARTAARMLAADASGQQQPGARHRVSRRLPTPPDVSAELAAEITSNLLDDLLSRTDALLAAPQSLEAAHDASVYTGSAGIGLELLHHASRPGVRKRLSAIVPFTQRAMTSVMLPPGLMVGRTGADVFLALAQSLGVEAAAQYPGPEIPDAGWQPDGADLTAGAAGVGIGHLMLSEITGDAAHRPVATRCVEYVLGRLDDGELSAGSDEPVRSLEREAVEPSTGRAHGLAGYVDLLLHAAERLGHHDSRVRAAEHAGHLAERAESLARRVPTRFSAPIAASWCQGLAGIAPVLLHAGDVLQDNALGDLARRLADVCLNFLPQVSAPVQCCGLVGIGNLFVDLALHDSSEHYWAAAHATARQLLIRSTGPVNHPVFVKDSLEEYGASWSFGVAGQLAFFRRLASHGGPGSLPLPIASASLTRTRRPGAGRACPGPAAQSADPGR